MKNENNQEILKLYRAESARITTYPAIYAVILLVYMYFLREIPYASVLPILIVILMRFLYIKYGRKNETSSLYSYSPIWSSVSILFFILIFVSEIFIGNENLTWVIGIFGATTLIVILLITEFIIFKDVGL